jgi:N-carbamoylputrescine amidase
MRVTVCELPHERGSLARTWERLCAHTARERAELVLLPECLGVEPFWESAEFDPARWAAAEAAAAAWLARLGELRAEFVIGTRPVTLGGRRVNLAYRWDRTDGVAPLRAKYFLPDLSGSWEAQWFDRGDPGFPLYQIGAAACGVNICTELWALGNYSGYAEQGAHLVLSPRASEAATTAKWLSAGVVAAARSGAFSLSSNRVEAGGLCGGVGWVIDPAGRVLARTDESEPFATADIDLGEAVRAKDGYPCSVFSRG